MNPGVHQAFRRGMVRTASRLAQATDVSNIGHEDVQQQGNQPGIFTSSKFQQQH